MSDCLIVTVKTMPTIPEVHPFARFELDPVLLTAITAQGFSRPMPIQGRSIPKIIEGRDVLARAETGSGKTAAYVLPLLQKLIYQRREEGLQAARGHHIRALILVPTRELALQVSEVVTALGAEMRPTVRCACVYGGGEIEHQVTVLKRGVEVLVATPARLLDLINAKAVVFNKLRTLVLDEVDRMVSIDFQDEVETILRHLPNSRQNLFFTATFPDSIRDLVRKVLDNPEVIDVPAGPKILIDQHVAVVNLRDKVQALNYLLKENDWKQVLVFATTKNSCNDLVKALQSLDVDVLALHGNIPTDQREAALTKFKTGDLRVLVATDIAARGLDIGSLDCVINFEQPRQANDYQHRIGRTGRAGKTGQAINLVSHHEMTHFESIEKFYREQFPRETIPGFEADAVAPPPPARKKPKKVIGKKRKVQRKVEKKVRREKKPFGSGVAKSESSSLYKKSEPETTSGSAYKSAKPASTSGSVYGKSVPDKPTPEKPAAPKSGASFYKRVPDSDD